MWLVAEKGFLFLSDVTGSFCVGDGSYSDSMGRDDLKRKSLSLLLHSFVFFFKFKTNKPRRMFSMEI